MRLCFKGDLHKNIISTEPNKLYVSSKYHDSNLQDDHFDHRPIGENFLFFLCCFSILKRGTSSQQGWNFVKCRVSLSGFSQEIFARVYGFPQMDSHSTIQRESSTNDRV